MKAAIRDIPLKPIYAAYTGDTPIKSIWKDDKKIWPDNSLRVTRIWLDIARLTPQQRIFWDLALRNTSAGANARRFIRLTASRTYNINRTYGNFALATHEGNGCISFPAGTGPLASEVVAGRTATLRLVNPATRSVNVGGAASDKGTVTYEFPPVPGGTEVRTWFGKGQKEVSTGTRVIVTGLPSGTTLLRHYYQQNGHIRCTKDLHCGYITPAEEDTAVRLSCTPHLPRGRWGAYLIYPAFDLTITPTILRIETTTIAS